MQGTIESHFAYAHTPEILVSQNLHEPFFRLLFKMEKPRRSITIFLHFGQ
jgi:hypothetical protein